jgi:hypothetical protein
MSIGLRCQCGKLQGEVDTRGVAARVVCYCKDCQAYARFLGRDADVLDAAGGTEVEATLPAAVRFTAGIEHLGCMSLSPRGPYRWYATCCRTPIGNTARDPKMSYVGLVRACLDAPAESLDRQLGRARGVVNRASAHGPVAATPAGTAWAVAKIGSMILRARLGGGYRDNPFFVPGAATPIRAPQVLTLDERKALTR